MKNLLKHFKELTVRPKNAQELKGLILQLAIQGKLTGKWRDENPNVESSSVLLKRIKLEKAKLVKDKKVRKSKNFSNTKDEEKYLQIPNNWEWSRIIEVGNLFNGNSVNKAVKESKYEGLVEGFSYLGTKDINYGFEQLNYDNGVRIPFNETNFKIAHKNTPLICSEGGSAGKKCGITYQDICFGNKLYALELYGKIESVLILSLYQTPIFFQEFQKRMTGIIGGISINSFGEIPIPIPPLEEQKEIVKVVETLFKEVEQLEQLTVERITLKEKFVTSALNQLTTNNAKKDWGFLQEHFQHFFNEATNIKKLRETVLQLAVQGKLTADWRANNLDTEDASILLKRIQKEKAQLIKEKKIKKEKALPAISKDEIPYELPEGWVWSNVLDISLKITDGEHATPIRTESGYKLLSARNVTNEGIRLHKVDYVGEEEFQRIRKRCDPQKGDVLISCSGSVGRVCLVDKDDEYCMVRSAALVKHHHENINGMFLCYALRSPILQEQILEKSRSTAQSNLFLGKIKELIFPLPPLEEQKAIVQKVNALMRLCDALEQQIDNSQTQIEQLMQSCLREVFEAKETLEN